MSSLKVWLRVIRVRFLLSSVIAVCLGLAISWWQSQSIDISSAVLTLAGVISLHASVDLLNDYWDFKREIDTKTKRTKFSGGTGVLPENLLKPIQVYRAGLFFLVIGSCVGGYFIYTEGITIALILAFAVVSIYFYSTSIVDSGLGEIFVAIKGTMIVLGTYFVQTSQIMIEPIIAGAAIGTLSAMVLFVNSFPDFEADKANGRKTLVILFGKDKASKILWIFPSISYSIIIAGILIQIFPLLTMITLLTVPLIIKYSITLRTSFENPEKLEAVMAGCITYSRLTGILFVLGFLFSHIELNQTF